jgi:hypothetical protein
VRENLYAIFRAFESYIQEQDAFDIIYSEKFGYVRISPDDDETLKILGTPQQMMDALFDSIICEVVYSPENPQKARSDFTLTEYEENEIRRRISSILETMEREDKAYCSDFLDIYLEAYQKGDTLEWVDNNEEDYDDYDE